MLYYTVKIEIIAQTATLCFLYCNFCAVIFIATHFATLSFYYYVCARENFGLLDRELKEGYSPQRKPLGPPDSKHVYIAVYTLETSVYSSV